MKKIIFMSILSSMFLTGCVLEDIKETQRKSNDKLLPFNEKNWCVTNSDCVISETDPDGFGTCVNKNWDEKQKNKPASEKVLWECLLTGEEKCTCELNTCQRTDSKPGC